MKKLINFITYFKGFSIVLFLMFQYEQEAKGASANLAMKCDFTLMPVDGIV